MIKTSEPSADRDLGFQLSRNVSVVGFFLSRKETREEK